MSDKPLLSDEDREKFRQYLKELDDKRRNAMLAAYEQWKESVSASVTSHVITAALAAASTKWLIPVIMKWFPL